MRLNVLCPVLLGLAIAVGTAAAVDFNGVVETFAHEVLIDSVVVSYDGAEEETFATEGWGGPPATIDTFNFPNQPGWPIHLLLYFRVDGGLTRGQDISSPERGDWHTLLDEVGQVMFYGESGVLDRPAAGLPSGALAVRPSILSHRAEFAFSFTGPGAALEVFDAAGNLVRRFTLAAGTRSLGWDGTDASGKQLAEGAYFCRLRTDRGTATRKLLIAR